MRSVTVKLAVVQVPHQSAVMNSPSTVRSAECTIPAVKIKAVAITHAVAEPVLVPRIRSIVASSIHDHGTRIGGPGQSPR